jgi:two-component system sensor histidine kinase/response regulator
VPFSATTANAFEKDRQQCRAAGMDGFVTKPVEPERLRACLAQWLAKDTTRDRLASPAV